MDRKDDARLMLKQAAELFPGNTVINSALKKLPN
jgi:hypothetical protein